MLKLRKKNTSDFVLDKKKTEAFIKIYPKDIGKIIGVYNYKDMMIIYTLENGKIHLSVSNKTNREIYDDELEKIAKKFIKDSTYTIQKPLYLLGILKVYHIREV